MLNIRFLFAVVFVALMLSNISAFGQKKIEIQLSQTLKYPLKARENKVEEVIYVHLDIDQEGEMKSFEILQSPNAILFKEVARSFGLIQKSWKKEFLEDRKLGQKYLVILEFSLGGHHSQASSLFEKAKEAIALGKKEEGLSLLDQCVELNPYNERYLSTRSNLNREMGKIEASQLDFMRAKKLKNELLCHLYITGYRISLLKPNDLPVGFRGHFLGDGSTDFHKKQFNQFLLQKITVQNNTDFPDRGLAFKWSKAGQFFLR